MLARIRNAVAVSHEVVDVPASRLKVSIAQILKEEGFIQSYDLLRAGNHRVLRLKLRYDDSGRPFINGVKRVSKPGLRVYVQKKEIPRVYAGAGVAVLSTSRGVMAGQKAWREDLGGELMFTIW